MKLHPVDFDLHELLESLGVMFQVRCQEKGLQWRLEGLDSSPLSVHGDKAKLNQVLMNLLGNAVKFTQEGEVVLKVTAQPEDGYCFEMMDTGMGIPLAEIQTLFHPFQQGQAGVQTGGTGLGLAIARRQVELLGGQLEVESALGQGSRFFFELRLPPALGAGQKVAAPPWEKVERLAFSKKMNLGMVVYNPLAGGLLTGKHRQERGPEAGTRFEMKKNYYDRYWSPGHFAAVEDLAAVAAKAGKSLTQLFLQWLLSQNHVDSVIIGVSKEAQLEENLRFAEGRLDEEALKGCDAVWQGLRGDHFAYNR
ncbi:MAG: aldo/keto reductase [Candidatus Latescibacteria bacterium]|nr:aldo/keto reductase [Candidatus Latescibacterota bacterium]